MSKNVYLTNDIKPISVRKCMLERSASVIALITVAKIAHLAQRMRFYNIHY